MASYPLGIPDRQSGRLASAREAAENFMDYPYEDSLSDTFAIDLAASLGLPVAPADFSMLDELENPNHRH